MLPAGSRYIGKQTWQAHQEMASGKFYGWALNPDLWPVPGRGRDA